ncbi:MAG: [protein-PII] uridylyltransferase, partial [Gammaproteobacteria bacterium]|nr:[protein-PII] uridylyltransferase [Gammaproteobacteria bacterium]
HSPDEIAWHTKAIARISEDKLPLILIREMTDRGASEIFIYMQDNDNIFSRAVKSLGQLNLNILDARVITSSNGYTLDTFIVLEENGEAISGKNRKNQIIIKLKEHLSAFDKSISTAKRFNSRILKHFPIKTQVIFSQDEENNRTIMEVIASDRPGFLAAIGTALEKSKTRILGAKIATYGERIEDIFFIHDKENNMINDEAHFKLLKNEIFNALEK